MNETYDTSQIAAIDRATAPGARLTVVTGAAGTGKTTTIRGIVAALGGTYAADLLAPTGKAAARLRQASGLGTSTVHSWLGFDGEGYHRTDPATRAVIVDEASMLDSQLLARVVNHRPPRLILVGDDAQLPPVGRGQPFHDLIRLRPELVARLTVCHRATAAICQQALAIRRGGTVTRRQVSGGESWEMIDTGDGPATERALLAILAERGYDPAHDVVISPVNGQGENEACSVSSLNRLLLGIANPHDEGQTWRAGDRVMCLENDHGNDWMNGDTGTVEYCDAVKGLPTVRTDRERDELLQLTPKHCHALTHAYAITCHKSQGSQYLRVYIPLLCRHSRMLTRAWLYTAVTRAQASVVMLGQLSVVRRAIDAVPMKRTALQELLCPHHGDF